MAEPKVPRRINVLRGRHALVDSIAFVLPVDSHHTPAMSAGFLLDAEQADALMPGEELHALRLIHDRGLLLVTVVEYGDTDIGKYIEYSLAIACTRGKRPLHPGLALLLRRRCGLGQYVHDLPVSTEISVRGGLGIWGMPKHQASLDFKRTATTVSSQYVLDGRLVTRLEIDRPHRTPLPINASGLSYSAFRGMLWQSALYVSGRAGGTLLRRSAGRLTIGDHSRANWLRALDVDPRAVFTAFVPNGTGVLDDHVQTWFLAWRDAPSEVPAGLEELDEIGLGREWLPSPDDELGRAEALQ